MHYVYILQSKKSGTYYIGVSNNVRRRFKEHNSGNSRSTAPHSPFELKRVERFSTIEEAYRREMFLKSKKSRLIIQKVIESSPDVQAELEVGIPISR